MLLVGILIVFTACSYVQTHNEYNFNSTNSLCIPVYTSDTALNAILDEVIFDQSTCEYFKYNNPEFYSDFWGNNDTLDIHIE